MNSALLIRVMNTGAQRSSYTSYHRYLVVATYLNLSSGMKPPVLEEQSSTYISVCFSSSNSRNSSRTDVEKGLLYEGVFTFYITTMVSYKV